MIVAVNISRGLPVRLLIFGTGLWARPRAGIKGNKDTYETLRDDFYKFDPYTAAIIDLINPGKK